MWPFICTWIKTGANELSQEKSVMFIEFTDPAYLPTFFDNDNNLDFLNFLFH